MKLFIIAFIVFLAIDAVWLGLVAPKLYKEYIGHLMTDKPNFIAALIFYVVFIIGLVYFVIEPNVVDQNLKRLIVSALLFGFVTYATYDLTNLATLKDWPITITVIDLVWGSFLSFATSILTFYIYGFLR